MPNNTKPANKAGFVYTPALTGPTGAERNRTVGLDNANVALSQLSYSPVQSMNNRRLRNTGNRGLSTQFS